MLHFQSEWAKTPTLLLVLAFNLLNLFGSISSVHDAESAVVNSLHIFSILKSEEKARIWRKSSEGYHWNFT